MLWPLPWGTGDNLSPSPCPDPTHLSFLQQLTLSPRTLHWSRWGVLTHNCISHSVMVVDPRGGRHSTSTRQRSPVFVWQTLWDFKSYSWLSASPLRWSVLDVCSQHCQKWQEGLEAIVLRFPNPRPLQELDSAKVLEKNIWKLRFWRCLRYRINKRHGEKKQPKAGITTNHFGFVESSFLLFLEVTVACYECFPLAFLSNFYWPSQKYCSIAGQ